MTVAWSRAGWGEVVPFGDVLRLEPIGLRWDASGAFAPLCLCYALPWARIPAVSTLGPRTLRWFSSRVGEAAGCLFFVPVSPSSLLIDLQYYLGE